MFLDYRKGIIRENYWIWFSCSLVRIDIGIDYFINALDFIYITKI